MKKAVLVGAGQFGRGGIGKLLEQSGYYVVLADINRTVIDDINARGEYTVRCVDDGTSVTVRNIRAVSSLTAEYVDECADADIICTCVGLSALGIIAPALAESIKKRRKSGCGKIINILACENALGGSTILKNFIFGYLDAEDAAYMEEHIGFPDCAIDSIIPPVADDLPADVSVEKYLEWDSLKSGFKGELPEIRGLDIVDDLTPYIERKLFTLNGPNAVTGAYGHLKGYSTVQEALDDPEIYDVVWSMMTEAGEMLARRHGFSPERMLEYREFIMRRFRNPRVIDTVARVAREPIRKLSPTDRIVTAMNLANGYGIETPAYITGVAAMLTYDNPDDAQSVELQKLIGDIGLEAALEKVSGIRRGTDVSSAIIKKYMILKNEIKKR